MVREETRYTFLLNSHIEQAILEEHHHSWLLSSLLIRTTGNFVLWARAQFTLIGLKHSCLPHKRASRDTIRRWIREKMAEAGVDTSIYKPHSVRSIATSIKLRWTMLHSCTLWKLQAGARLLFLQGYMIKRSTQVHPLRQVSWVAHRRVLLCYNSCAISCFEISRYFEVRMMKKQNPKLNETYLKSKFDWNSAESSAA